VAARSTKRVAGLNAKEINHKNGFFSEENEDPIQIDEDTTGFLLT
jgi:hypothetical protein